MVSWTRLNVTLYVYFFLLLQYVSIVLLLRLMYRLDQSVTKSAYTD